MTNWKRRLKQMLPLCPFVHTDRYHILELRRTQYNTINNAITEIDSPFYCCDALYETDFSDIIGTFPQELNRTDIANRIEKRFQEKMPCFAAKDRQTDKLLGAAWMNPNGYSFLQEYTGRTVFWVTNLYVCSEFQGKGIAKQLLSFAVRSVFQQTCCEAVLSQIRIEREASLRTHLRVGFGIIGGYSEQHIGNYWYGNFKRRQMP